MSWYVFVGVLATNDGGGENGIRRRLACGDCEGRQEAQFGDQRVDKCRRDKPALQRKKKSWQRSWHVVMVTHPGHDRREEEK